MRKGSVGGGKVFLNLRGKEAEFEAVVEGSQNELERMSDNKDIDLGIIGGGGKNYEQSRDKI